MDKNSFGDEFIPVAAAAATASSSGAQAGGTANLYHLQLIGILKIDSVLSDRSKKGLRWCYKKYKAFNAAVQLMDQMSRDGKWPLGARKPGHTELVEIFMSKSYWHSHVAKPFGLVACHPQMVAWLDDDDDGPSDFEVWNLQKSEYGFKELKDWLKNGGTLDKAAKGRMEKSMGKTGKGKKEKGKEIEADNGGKGKGKEKEKEIEVDDGGKGKGKSNTSSSKTHKRK